VVARFELEVQRLAADRRVRGVEGVADLLRLLGPLTADEVAARLTPAAGPGDAIGVPDANGSPEMAPGDGVSDANSGDPREATRAQPNGSPEMAPNEGADTTISGDPIG